MRILITMLIIGGMALAPAACGSKNADEKKQAVAPAKKPEGKPLLMGEKPAPGKKSPAPKRPRPDSPSAPAAVAKAPPSTIPLDESTPEGAIKTFVTRLAAGDLHGAVEVCVPDAPGAVALGKAADGFDRAAAEGMDPKTLAGLMVGHLKGAAWEKGEETPDKVVFKVTPKGKEGVNIEVIRVGEVWRVTPPPQTGIPM